MYVHALGPRVKIGFLTGVINQNEMQPGAFSSMLLE